MPGTVDAAPPARAMRAVSGSQSVLCASYPLQVPRCAAAGNFECDCATVEDSGWLRLTGVQSQNTLCCAWLQIGALRANATPEARTRTGISAGAQ